MDNDDASQLQIPTSASSDGTDVLLPPSPLDASSLPGSPSASTFLRTAETLEGLAAQLGEIKDAEIEFKCCCGSAGGCSTTQDRERLEGKLKLSGEIGNALLQRYEALEKKQQRDVERYERQLEAKRNALLESVRRVNTLEKANHTHLQRYSDLSKKMEILEKRYTQSLHTQTLTQQSLTHVRAELTSFRDKTRRQSVQLASGAGWEERLADAEKRYEEAREAGDVEAKQSREEAKRRKRAEARIQELESQLFLAQKEVEDVKEARAKDASDLLANARDRLSTLHNELSETFRADGPSDTPEYQRALEELVANNALLKHDVAELSHTLTEIRDENRVYRTEIDDLRSVIGVARRVSPEPPHSVGDLASEMSHTFARNHIRTGSIPQVSEYLDRPGFSRLSIGPGSVEGVAEAWEKLNRRSSVAPSFRSFSTDGRSSPGLGLGHIGEYASSVGVSERDQIASPQSGRSSPRPMFRSSPSGGIGYVLNGVPKVKAPASSGSVGAATARSAKRQSIGARGRSYASTGVDPIAENAPSEIDASTTLVEPDSPGASEYFRQSDLARKRRSLLLQRRQTASPGESIDYGSIHGTLADLSAERPISPAMPDAVSPTSQSAIISSHLDKRVHRRTLMLLSRSKGVQTEETSFEAQDIRRVVERISPQPSVEQRSETSSLHDGRTSLGSLLDTMTKLLTRLHSSDIPTLNKRLKAARLPGDVGHLSQTTLKALHTEVGQIRHQFRGLLEGQQTTRKDMILLLKLLKDMFIDMIELQSVLNDVTVDPSLAKRMHRKALREGEDGTVKAPAGGLSWIAAPITKLFVTPGGEQTTPTKGDGHVKDGLLAPIPVRAAPKLSASISATATHVSFEAGTAIARSMSQRPSLFQSTNKVMDTLPPSPTPQDPPTVSANIVDSDATSTLRAPVLRHTPSRANRSELLGIFAGAQNPRQPSPTGGGAWQVLGHPTSLGLGPPPATGKGTLRIASSQYFADRTSRHPRDTPSQRKRLSAMVDAVIDTTVDELADAPVSVVESDDNPQPSSPVLHRRLRPRGLSDSSIRSTFVSQAKEVDLTAPVPRNVAGPSVPAKRGMLAALSSRMWSYAAPTLPAAPADLEHTSATTPVDDGNVKGDGLDSSPESTPEQQSTLQIPTVALNAPTPPRPINMSRTKSRGSDGPLTSPTGRATSPTSLQNSSTGLLGRLASSFAPTSSELEEEDEIRAHMRHPVVGPRSYSRTGSRGLY